MEAFLLNVQGVAGAVFLFGFAIFIHELGHFLLAKWCGVGVSKFAIGFGPKIVSFVRGETEYSIRWFPLGGFVALKGMMEGMDEEEEEPEDASSEEDSDSAPKEQENKEEKKKSANLTEDLDALKNKPYLVKVAVFGAGVTFNFLSAVALMVVLLVYGLPMSSVRETNQIEEVPEGTEMYKAGWRSGDRVVGVHLEPVTSLGSSDELVLGSDEFQTWDDVLAGIGRLAPSPKYQTLNYLKRLFDSEEEKRNLLVTVQRNGQRKVLPFPIAYFGKKEGQFFSPSRPPYILLVQPSTPAARARLVKDNYTMGEVIRPYPAYDEMKETPLEGNDLVLAVNHEPVETWFEMTKILRANPDKPVTLTIQRGKEKKIMLLTTTLEHDEENPEYGKLGVYPGNPLSDERECLPFTQALIKAPGRTLILADRIVYETVKLFATKSGKEIKRNLGGPAAIVKLAYDSAKKGLADYLNLFIVISIILAIMNLLPIPVLDGGYIIISTIEAIIRRPIPQAILAPVLTVFMIAFLILFAFLFSNDFMNLFYKF